MSETADNPKLCGACGLMHPSTAPCQSTAGPTGFKPSETPPMSERSEIRHLNIEQMRDLAESRRHEIDRLREALRERNEALEEICGASRDSSKTALIHRACRALGDTPDESGPLVDPTPVERLDDWDF
jgi:hypothetical protein